MNKTLRLAALLIVAYSLTVLANGAFYTWWGGDTAEVGRMLIRVAGAALIAWGLWRAERWAWWFGLIFTALLTLFGALGLLAGLASGLFENRPYPGVDVAFFAIAIGTLATGLVLLLLPASRATVKRRADAAN